MSSPLDDATLAAIAAAERAYDEIEAGARRARWAMRVSWEIATPPNGLWCLVDTTHFLAVGGPGWQRALGYDPREVEGQPWSRFLADDVSAAQSLAVVAENLREGKGVESFRNRYRHKDGGTRGIRWRISPWVSGRAVAYGEVDDV